MMTDALLILDMQGAMQLRVAEGRDCVNADAPARIAALAAHWRARGWPVAHVHHHETDPADRWHRDNPAAQPLRCSTAAPGEPVFWKTTSSAFASTDLADWLRGQGITGLVVTGAVAGFCVASTVRAGADLGFAMTVVSDAVMGFDLPEAGLAARPIFEVSMALLGAEFARLTTSAALLAA